MMVDQPTGEIRVADSEDSSYGALVGWTTQGSGDRLTLRLQSVKTPPPHTDEDVHSFYVVMDRQQAVQLGNFLFDMAGQSLPEKPRRNWLARMLAP